MDKEFGMCDNQIPDEDDYPHLHRDDEVSEDDYEDLYLFEDLTDEEN